jgi:hypothetical protein
MLPYLFGVLALALIGVLWIVLSVWFTISKFSLWPGYADSMAWTLG